MEDGYWEVFVDGVVRVEREVKERGSIEVEVDVGGEDVDIVARRRT